MSSFSAHNENIYSEQGNMSNAEFSNNAGPENLQMREENLRRKEKDLLERKSRLEKLEKEMGALNVRQDNWPCLRYPVTYHSITQEIPAFARTHMTRMYALVLITFVAFFWNFITEMSMYLIDVVESTDLLFAVIYAGTGVFGAWKCWYRQIYYALRDRKAIKWSVFFLFFVSHCLFAALMTLAPGYFPAGAAGIWTLTDAMQKNAVVGIFVLVNSLLWLLLDVGSWYYLIQSWRLCRARRNEPVETQLISSVDTQLIASVAAI